IDFDQTTISHNVFDLLLSACMTYCFWFNPCQNVGFILLCFYLFIYLFIYFCYYGFMLLGLLVYGFNF
ncbi:MAG: hypothetical protein N7Q72_06425, partial [Spiroplasma sp. Tabriz.8]|nr:hypothetical protein [Spiroplasma sp. Tabriz.8]